MNKTMIVKHPIGAALAIVIVLASSVGVYAAATNWFNGEVRVTVDDSVMTVDLSQCSSRLPPGVEPTADRKKVQFKILGNPHIDTSTFQRRLLAGCELDSIRDFYAQQSAIPQKDQGRQLYQTLSQIKKVDVAAGTVTLSVGYSDVPTNTSHRYDKVFTVAKDAPIYNQGQQISLKDLKIGDQVLFAYYNDWPEDHPDAFSEITIVQSIFKTQYDDHDAPEDSKAFYEQANIMPLDLYSQIHKQ